MYHTKKLKKTSALFIGAFLILSCALDIAASGHGSPKRTRSPEAAQDTFNTNASPLKIPRGHSRSRARSTSRKAPKFNSLGEMINSVKCEIQKSDLTAESFKEHYLPTLSLLSHLIDVARRLSKGTTGETFFNLGRSRSSLVAHEAMTWFTIFLSSSDLAGSDVASSGKSEGGHSYATRKSSATLAGEAYSLSDKPWIVGLKIAISATMENGLYNDSHQERFLNPNYSFNASVFNKWGNIISNLTSIIQAKEQILSQKLIRQEDRSALQGGLFLCLQVLRALVELNVALYFNLAKDFVGSEGVDFNNVRMNKTDSFIVTNGDLADAVPVQALAGYSEEVAREGTTSKDACPTFYELQGTLDTLIAAILELGQAAIVGNRANQNANSYESPLLDQLKSNYDRIASKDKEEKRHEEPQVKKSDGICVVQ